MFVVNRELLGGLDSGFKRSLRVFRKQGRLLALGRAGRLAQRIPERNSARVVEFPFRKLSQFALGEPLNVPRQS